jgi:peptidoglycan/LPS O-acetylase OafA/YrhL
MSDLPYRQSDATGTRSQALDGLRGVAALTVMILHFTQIFRDTAYEQYATFSRFMQTLSATPVSLIWGGSQAVTLFFVLSGFVLHRMLASTPMSYPSFAARRVIRLWLPYIAVINLAALGIYVAGSQPIQGQSAWLNDLLGTRLSRDLLLSHVLMLGSFDTKRIDPVIWSLVIELRLSLIFPLIYVAVSEWRLPVVLGMSLTVAGAGAYLAKVHHSPSASMYATMACQIYFVLGALAAAHENRLRAWYAALPGAVTGCLGTLAVLLYCNNLPHVSPTLSYVLGALWIFVMALGSTTFRRLLCLPFAQWLGRISYSLYLSHFAILLFLINLLHPQLSFTAIVAIAVPVSFVLSTMLYLYVELPSITMSRIVGRRLMYLRQPAARTY